MKSNLTPEIITWLEEAKEEACALLEELCLIPAPSHYEDERAAFVKAWLENVGAKGVYIDEAKNVVFPLNCEGRSDLICFEAHTDTVFPMETPLSFTKDEENFYCPGIGDDTANLVNMLMVVKYILQKGIKPRRGVLFVANSCEEGLGNLKGTRQIFKDYEGRIQRFVTFDGYYTAVTCKSVGSHRYEILSKTEGGHSWSRFGNTNAIIELARLIGELSSIPLPQKEGAKTTFNVGLIEGGTSVNTIAQNASMLYEYRSDDAECLAYMEKAFKEKIEAFRKETKAEIQVTVVGERPCGEAKDAAVQKEMILRCKEISEHYSGRACAVRSGSTDCNIPLSLGIPAVCPGILLGGKAHTREEFVNIESMTVGLKIGAEIILDYFEV